MSREQKTEKSAPNIGEKQECRACLCKLDSIDVSYQIFDTWNPPMQGTQATIAEDLAKAANIQLSPNDKHSKLICKCCCDKLQEVCRFTSMVQDNDKILQLRYPNRESETTMWPKPITIDKNILYDNSDVKIKEEVLSEDEYSAAMEVEKGFATVDIKVEPEEILPDKIEIKINGTISLNEYKSENPVTNGDDCEVYEQEEYRQPAADVTEASPKNLHADRSGALGQASPAIFASSTLHPALTPAAESPSYLEEVKEEPVSDDDDSDACADLSLDCMLCSKPFKTISGLKAHVIAMHSYKSVRRRSVGTASPDRPAPAPAPAKHVCATCRRSFTTPTDLMVHETCHARAACYGCGGHFNTPRELAAHAARCRPAATRAPAPATAQHKPKRKTSADTIRPPPDDSIKKKSASSSPRACALCGERFTDPYYLRIHREIHHTGPAEAEPEGGASAMDTSALENIFTGND